MGKMEIFKEFWEFSKQRKKLWILPIVIILLLVSVFIIAFEGSAIAPFIYALF